MQRKSLSILFLLSAVMAMAAPVSAKPKAPPDLSYSPPPKTQTLQYDHRLLEAAEIAQESARRHSHHHCWRAVKDALYEANALPSRPTSKYAWQAGEELEQKFAFTKLDISDPFAAPVGSILVYGGPGAGHVEFRTEDGFVSDFENPRPSRRPLLGVYVSFADPSEENLKN
jgi:hypothetical protein